MWSLDNPMKAPFCFHWKHLQHNTNTLTRGPSASVIDMTTYVTFRLDFKDDLSRFKAACRLLVTKIRYSIWNGFQQQIFEIIEIKGKDLMCLSKPS